MKFIIESRVPSHEGACVHTWMNDNQVDNRLHGATGFFRRVKVWKGLPLYKFGPEFHGVIRRGVVETTQCKEAK